MNKTLALGIFVCNQFTHPTLDVLEMNQSKDAYGVRHLVNSQYAVGFWSLLKRTTNAECTEPRRHRDVSTHEGLDAS